ncbi:hypothetical protein LXL04_006317 [Taraxacum kok-saghyz]
MIDMLVKCGYKKGTTLFGYRYNFRQSNSYDLESKFLSNDDGYAKAGKIDDVEKMFDEMPERDVISWSSLITGYVQNENLEQALDSFKRMSDL